MKRIIIIYILGMLMVQPTMAQNAKSASDSTKIVIHERQVNFNMTPFTAQFIPFNAINPLTSGPVNIGAKIFSNNVGYRFGIGVNINDGNSNQNMHFNMRNGYEIRRSINNQWNYSHGCDAILSLGNLNLPGNTSENGQVLVGLAPFWGVEYCFSKNLSISTETSLLIGISSGNFLDSNPFRLQFIPPIALYLNLKH